MSNKIVVIVTLLLAMPYTGPSQTEQQPSTSVKVQSSSTTQSGTAAGPATLVAGSRIDARLTSTLDLKKAKPGDRFKLKAIRPVRSDGKEVISKDSIISGHIEQITTSDNEIFARLIFDQLDDAKTRVRTALEARVTAVISARRPVAPVATDEMILPSDTSRVPRSTTTSNSGLLGGVAKTVDGATGKITSQIEATTGASLETDLSGKRGGNRMGTGPVQIVGETNASLGSISTLVVRSSKPKIESGTQFVLRTASELKIDTNKSETDNRD